MATQGATTNGQTTTKSGKGNVSGVVSELSTFWTVMPGHEEGVREGIQLFLKHVQSLPPERSMSDGPAGRAVRDLRQRHADVLRHGLRDRLGHVHRRRRPGRRHAVLHGLAAAPRRGRATRGLGGEEGGDELEANRATPSWRRS